MEKRARAGKKCLSSSHPHRVIWTGTQSCSSESPKRLPSACRATFYMARTLAAVLGLVVSGRRGFSQDPPKIVAISGVLVDSKNS